MEGEHGTQHVLEAFVVVEVNGVNALKLGVFSVDWPDVAYNLGLLQTISESKKMQIVITTQYGQSTANHPVVGDVTGSNSERDKLENGIFDPGRMPLFISGIVSFR